MNYYKILFILLLLGLLFNGMAAEKPVLAQTDPVITEDQTVVYTPTEGSETVPTALTAITDLVSQGVAWQPQTRWNLKYIKPYAWGTEIKSKLIGDQWFHIAVPYISRFDGTMPKLQYVEFCGKASNGAATKPFRMDVWSNTNKIGDYTFTWPADNNYHCVGHTYATPAWYESLGISVWVHFANTTDVMVLDKAWARITP